MGNEYWNALAHHGIKGQKWGVRNGPPYPLNEGAKSSAEMRVDGAAEVAALLAVPALALAAVGIRKHAENKRVNLEMERAKEYSNDKKYAGEREKEKIDPNTGLYLTGRKMTEAENMERVNPSYGKSRAFGVNCTMCTAAMELRERGYDVHAGTDGKSMVKRGGVSMLEREKWYGLKSSDDVYFHTQKLDPGLKELKSRMLKEGDSRGELLVEFPGGGHSVYYKIQNGDLKLYDAQSNKMYSKKYTDVIFEYAPEIGYRRLDNVDMDIDYMRKNNIIC